MWERVFLEILIATVGIGLMFEAPGRIVLAQVNQ
jgi:hypothetical protein